MKKFAILIVAAALSDAQAQMQTGDGIWVRNAYYGERQTFDACVGHQPPNGAYHHHASPTCLRAQLGDNVELVSSKRTGNVYREATTALRHSPILGWSFDGYPIYGPYGYSEARNASSAIRRIRSGYKLRGITQRNTLPDWALAVHPGVSQVLTAQQQGPPINAEFPLGRYVEDHEWAAANGDLDVHNGRFTVTPEYPNGTYAYFVTIEADGSPAFPYILGGTYFGVVTTGRVTTIPSGATDATGTSAEAILSSWATKNAAQDARVVSATNPAAGPSTTWPNEVPAGIRFNGGVTTPTKADTQRVRYTDSMVYINANGLASYTMGPWFEGLMTGGIFMNLASSQNYQMQISRLPQEASTKTAVGGGAVGMWVNGVPVFNYLDGASYSLAQATDVGGGLVRQTAVHASSASGEQGPWGPNSYISAYPLFGAVLAVAGETTVSVRDSAGTTRTASVSYASAEQVNYRLPEGTANGAATVTISAGGKSYAAGIYVTSVYPHLFLQTTRATAENGDVYLTLYGSGRGSATQVSATVGGLAATVAYAGPQGQFVGLDQYNIILPRSLAKGTHLVELLVEGIKSNQVPVVLE